MYGILNYTVIGGKVPCPDCFRVMANPHDGTSCTIQQTLFRKHEESDLAFWNRTLDVSRSLVGPMGLYAWVVIFCEYDQPYIPNVEIHDSRINTIRTLEHVADTDPSQRVRVKAIFGLCDILEAEVKRKRNAEMLPV